MDGYDFDEQENSGEWQSKTFLPQQAIQVDVLHHALFERVEASISTGFSSVQRALTDLQLQIQMKLRQLREQQELILETQSPGPGAHAEFQQSITKIDRACESFTAHADNLSHIKLTLARAAAFVSSEGNLAQLVTKTPSSGSPVKSWPEDYRQAQRETHLLPKNSVFLQENSTFLGNFAHAATFVPRSNSPEIVSGAKNLHTLEQNSHYAAQRRVQAQEPISTSSHRIANATCFVFYLPPTATNETLRTLFQPYGTVLNAYVAIDKVTYHSRGFGFVDFSSPQEAQRAIAGLDKLPLEGKFLSVSLKV